jgi:2-polyprenyl-6-hydroxyphenyl methylase/3-demethylubiquinone-9 3-methyltransferase
MSDLKGIDSHFAFGENWASYAALVDRLQIEEAKKGLLRLVPAQDLAGKSFLDIGCGSGLHSLAALELGAQPVLAIDLDPNSVATTRSVLSKNAPLSDWTVQTRSVFDLDPAQGAFDVAYSWGVLHHTGGMWEAVRKAAGMVAPGGLLVIALYRRTSLDRFWSIEKRFYASAPESIQRLLRWCYVAAFRAALMLTGRNFRNYVANYKSSRGMDFHHDVHDWLGGYPYEAALAGEVESALTALGFKPERVNARPKSVGLFGSGCDEYVYRASLSPAVVGAQARSAGFEAR